MKRVCGYRTAEKSSGRCEAAASLKHCAVYKQALQLQSHVHDHTASELLRQQLPPSRLGSHAIDPGRPALSNRATKCTNAPPPQSLNARLAPTTFTFNPWHPIHPATCRSQNFSLRGTFRHTLVTFPARNLFFIVKKGMSRVTSEVPHPSESPILRRYEYEQGEKVLT